jgi:hypothetical protein
MFRNACYAVCSDKRMQKKNLDPVATQISPVSNCVPEDATSKKQHHI